MGIIEKFKEHWFGGIIVVAVVCITGTWFAAEEIRVKPLKEHIDYLRQRLEDCEKTQTFEITDSLSQRPHEIRPENIWCKWYNVKLIDIEIISCVGDACLGTELIFDVNGKQYVWDYPADTVGILKIDYIIRGVNVGTSDLVLQMYAQNPETRTINDNWPGLREEWTPEEQWGEGFQEKMASNGLVSLKLRYEIVCVEFYGS